jgi:hypothetical protein
MRTGSVDARIVSECYSDLVLRIPWYVAWPLLIAFGALALQFVLVRSVYFPVKHPGGFWNLQAQLGATDVWLDATDHVRNPPRKLSRVVCSFAGARGPKRAVSARRTASSHSTARAYA